MIYLYFRYPNNFIITFQKIYKEYLRWIIINQFSIWVSGDLITSLWKGDIKKPQVILSNVIIENRFKKFTKPTFLLVSIKRANKFNTDLFISKVKPWIFFKNLVRTKYFVRIERHFFQFFFDFVLIKSTLSL